MSFIEKNWLLILVMFASGAMLLWPILQRRMSPIKDVGNLNVTHLINHKNALLLDVREDKEFEGGKLPDAVHIPLSKLDERASELAAMTGRPVVAYCSRGQRSRSAASALTKLGFTEVYSLSGGIKAWKDAGLPVVAVSA